MYTLNIKEVICFTFSKDARRIFFLIYVGISPMTSFKSLTVQRERRKVRKKQRKKESVSERLMDGQKGLGTEQVTK